MVYCIIADVQKMLPDTILIEVTDDEGAPDAIETTRLQESIDSGGEEIDAIIGGVVLLPITGTVPPILGKLNVDIAIYNVYSRLMEEIPQTRIDRYKRAIEMLMQIAEGEISIGIQPPPAAPVSGAGWPSKTTRNKEFTSDTLDMY